MNLIKPLLATIVVYSIFNVTIVLPSIAQGSISVTGGVGIMEAMHAGISFQEDQTVVGLKLGTWPGEDDEVFTFTFDVSAHLLGHSDLSDLKPFYIKAGYTYFAHSSYTYNSVNTGKHNILFIRPGREFNISRRFGINLDGGILVLLSSSNYDSNFGSFSNDDNGDVLPSGSLGVYYKF